METGDNLFNEWFPLRGAPPTREQIDKNMAITLEVQHACMVQHNKPPFACILVAPDHETVLLKQHNVSYIRHAESSLALSAADQFPPAYLWQCTMYSTWEPCAMCAGTVYWANIGRVVFAASWKQLLELTGPNNPMNFTSADSCVPILQGGQKFIEIGGPLDDWSERVVDDADWFWSKTETRVEAAKREVPSKS
ncbi:hypothetical protein DHEL01_v209310 [Diaporthe helianthi]|uniref:CMP/dCMP-type deaminase domain-containing protein n=1 Tax=Diaporthe helianthi TaxID=158607 RepID=A0A2P5HPW9_DIAHE|nr:hypothetical protein DHEL01_v209310 [Diaporthe helianthi]